MADPISVFPLFTRNQAFPPTPVVTVAAEIVAVEPDQEEITVVEPAQEEITVELPDEGACVEAP